MQTYRLNPGYLVVGGVQQRGCVSYHVDDKAEERTGAGAEVKRWRTERTTANPEEQKRLTATRGDLHRKIAACGMHLAGFGYVVPAENADRLRTALEAVSAAVRDYNATATCTRLMSLYAVYSIGGTDERLAVALYERATTLLTEAADACARGDVKALRQALNDLSGAEALIPGTTGEKIAAAIEDARKQARAAVRLVKEQVTTRNIPKDSEEAQGLYKTALAQCPVNALRAELVEILNDAAASETGVVLPPVDARSVELPPEENAEPPAVDVFGTRAVEA